MRIFLIQGQLILLMLCVSFSGAVRAATAAFSADGSHVFVLRDGELVDVDVKARRALPMAVDIGADINSIAYSADGLLAVTENNLWRIDYLTHRPLLLCNGPPDVELYEAAFDPVSKNVLVSAVADCDNYDGNNLFLLVSGTTELKSIRNRRLASIQAPIFDLRGNLYFGAEGDIWKGAIAFDESDQSLNAFRIAPVATRETCNCTPLQMGAGELALAGDNIYASVRRMGGSGWGETVRLRLLQEPRVKNEPMENEGELVKGNVEDYVAILSSLQTCGDNGGVPSYLCSLPGQRKIFYSTLRQWGNSMNLAERQFWLGESDAEPQPIEIDFSALAR